jgi:hypothetical protein
MLCFTDMMLDVGMVITVSIQHSIMSRPSNLWTTEFEDLLVEWNQIPFGGQRVFHFTWICCVT